MIKEENNLFFAKTTKMFTVDNQKKSHRKNDEKPSLQNNCDFFDNKMIDFDNQNVLTIPD